MPCSGRTIIWFLRVTPIGNCNYLPARPYLILFFLLSYFIIIIIIIIFFISFFCPSAEYASFQYRLAVSL